MVDNLTDALMMAGAVLIFVIMLTVSISSFTTVRTQFDSIIERDFQLDLVKDDAGNYMNYHTSDSDIRVVGAETVVSSMYRVMKENYVVYIVGLTGISGNIVTTNVAEVQKYNTVDIVSTSQDVIKISISGENSNIDKILRKDTDPDPSIENGYNLYNKLKGEKFKEYLGVYKLATDESVDDINKTTYRVITYVKE